MRFEFDGLQELTQQLENMKMDTEKGKEEALKKGAEVMKKATEAAAPHLTGTLKTSVLISDMKNGEVEVYVDQQGKGYYGFFHEFGTSRMPARPFMGPAFQKNSRAIEQVIAMSLRLRMGMSV